MNGSAKRLMGASALVAVLALGSVQAVAAQAGGGGGGGGGGGQQAPADPPLIAYRKAMMNANAQHQGALRVLLNPANASMSKAADIKMHAAALDNQGKMFAAIFPEGSMGATSRAKAEIWSMKDDFGTKVKAFVDASHALNEAAMKGDNAATNTAFTAFNATCGGCHMVFRGPPIAAPAPAAAPAPN